MNKPVEQIDYKKQLEQAGALVFASEEVPLSKQQWLTLENLSREVSYEHVIGGDAGEGHSVYVSRFVNDVLEPEDLQPQTAAIRKIIMSETMVGFYQGFIGKGDLCLRRCQANLLKENDYIGKHIDQHSNPDYIASIVFHFDSEYTGGDFVSQPDTGTEIKIHPLPHTVVVNKGHIWHEVEPVTSGERRTLACFLSSQFGQSRPCRQEFKVSN